MGIIDVIIVLVVIGLLLGAANRWLPMDEKMKQILNAVVIFFVIVWLLAVFFPGIRNVRIPN